MHKEKLYIAYGSNLNLVQMKYRCPTAKVAGTSEIKDYELLFRGSKTGSYATIEPCEGSSVPVLIWSVKPRDEIALDRYEGYPRFYEKETIKLDLNGKAVSAFVYVMTEGHQLGMSSESYRKTIEEGYRTAGFDTSNLSFLRKHFDYSDNLCNLEFIEEYTRKFQKLFPYQFFMSREAVIKKESCSICSRINTIRNRCKHEVGELYMGEMCIRVVEDVEFLAESIVTNPFDKYTVLFPQGMEYNYEALDILFKGLNTPYDRWMLEIEKSLKSEFVGVQRNAPCPCGSGKKYKKCCYGTDSEIMDHNKITLLDRTNFTPIPYKTMGTWKNNEQK